VIDVIDAPPTDDEIRATGLIHVEMYDGRTFCGEHGHALKQDAWHRAPENIQKATCERCLLRIFMCGDSARIAIERLGGKVDGVDVDPAPVNLQGN
jgi:hypothetical protein